MRRLLIAWLALLVLLLALSAGSALLPQLADVLLAVSLAIAAAKVAIVAWVFMELRTPGRPLPRLAAAAGCAMLAVLLALSGLDLRTRHDERAAWQRPQAVPPLIEADR